MSGRTSRRKKSGRKKKGNRGSSRGGRSGPDPGKSLRFSKINGLVGLGSLAAIAVGYALLAQGSVTLAPLLLVLGYVVLAPLAIIL